jgi:hypothetical protein
MATIKVRMSLSKQTKNTYLYTELDDKGVPVPNMYHGHIGQVYVKQKSFEGRRPMTIDVTIEEVGS